MKRLPVRMLWLAFAALPCGALAQVDVSSIISGGIEVLQREGKLPAPAGSPFQSDPLEPKGHPGLEPKIGELPPPQAGTQLFEVVDIGGESRQIGDRFLFTGGVHIRYKGYDIKADEVEGSRATNIFTATGNVRLIGQDSTVTGEKVTVNFDERTFRAENSDAQLRPSFVQGRLLDDLYIRGGLAYGSEREVWGENTTLTTCNLDHPHYQLIAQRLNVRPGRRMILRKVDVEILHHHVIRIPYVSIPLDQTNDRYFPEIGQSPDEGYYIKSRIGVPLRGDDGLVARLDYMTKLGAGLGGDYRYDTAYTRGNISAYGIIGAVNTFNAHNDHEMWLGSGLLKVTNDLQRNNYLNAPESTIVNSDLKYTLLQGRGTQTVANFRRYSNESAGFRSENQTLSLQDQRQWGRRDRGIGATRTTANVDLVRTDSGASGGTSVQSERLDVRLDGSHDLGQATAQIQYNRSIPVGETTNFFSPADVTPLVALKSDSKRLLGDAFSRILSFNTEVSMGEFVSRGTDRVTRSNFDFNFNRRDPAVRRSTLNVNGRFRQGLYSDDTAQYVAGMGIDYNYRLGGDSTKINLRYNYLRGYGFTPLQIDRVGRTNFVSADLTMRPIRSLLLGAGSGYDFLLEQREQIAWQTAGLRAEYEPTNWFQFRSYATYDPRQHAFNSVRLDFAYFPGSTRVLAGLRYDGIRHTWGNANILIDGLKWGRLNFSTLLSYNGYLKKFEARHFSFTYDLHCAEAILQIIDNPTGFRSGRQVTFFLRLKALPFDTPFGVGTRGQPLGIGTGSTFSGG